MFNLFSQNVWNNKPTWYRTTLIRELVSECDADICMFQEFGPHSIMAGDKPLQNLMSDEYETCCKDVAYKNYTPVYYKRNKFDAIDDGYLLFDGLNDFDSKSVSWVLLCEKSTGVKLIVCSTHFWWKYDNSADNEQRIKNAVQLKQLCDGLIEKYGVPVIIGGDFNNGYNAEQGDEPYKRMLELGFKDFRYIAESTTETCTHHDYPVLNADETYDKGGIPDKIIDYIFLYGNFDVNVKRFGIITSDKALTSSDHCPLVGSIEC